MDRNGWHVSFLEADCRTTLPLKLTFLSEGKILAMYERCGATHLLEDRQALEMGITMGRGSCWLSLSEEQYRQLKKDRAWRGKNPASVVRHTDGHLLRVARARVTFSRMSVAFAVQMKGFGFWLCPSM